MKKKNAFIKKTEGQNKAAMEWEQKNQSGTTDGPEILMGDNNNNNTNISNSTQQIQESGNNRKTRFKYRVQKGEKLRKIVKVEDPIAIRDKLHPEIICKNHR